MQAFAKFAGALVLLALPTLAFADGHGAALSKKAACPDTVGAPIVNVTEHVFNDEDSGTAGNYWAFDTIERHITVWQTSVAGTYCADIRDEGRFKTIAGQTSPAKTATLTGNEHGTIHGGYVLTITGSMLATPAWKTKGNVGKVDYQCDGSGNCPGYINWLGQYFAAGYHYTYGFWGWTYRGGRYGTWVNASTGNSGDITPAPAKGHSGDDHGKSDH